MPNSNPELVLVVRSAGSNYVAEHLPDQSGRSRRPPVELTASRSGAMWGLRAVIFCERAAALAAPAVSRVNLSSGHLRLELSDGVVMSFSQLDQDFGIIRVRSDSLPDSLSLLQTSDLLDAEEITFRGGLRLELPDGVTVRVIRRNDEEHEVEITKGSSGAKCRF